MRLVDYLDKGASVDPEAPCLTLDDRSLTYREVQGLAARIAAALAAQGVRPGGKVAILSANDPTSFSCVFGISLAGAVWCPINPRNEAAENRDLLSAFDCEVLIYQEAFAPLVDRIADDLPGVHTFVCVDGSPVRGIDWDTFLEPAEAVEAREPEGVAMLVGTGGTTGKPKGVLLTETNLETMTSMTLIGYPFGRRPVYLAIAPLTHAAGVLCLPVLALGGEIVIMRSPDVHRFLELVEHRRVTHTFMPPTLIYALLGSDRLDATDLSSLECFWYGAAPMSVTRLEESLRRIGPVMGQLFGQTEAPMMISMLPPAEHFEADGSVATGRLASAGRPAPLVTVEIMDEDGTLLARGERGEVVVRSSLVMAGYYRNPEATAEASAFGWHHTGDIGYLDDDGYLFIVDRAKDMIISGGFNVYSTEVEQAVMAFDGVRDCAVLGLPDEKWGERVVAVVQAEPGTPIDGDALRAFVKERIGSVKTPKEVHVWDDLPRSKVGKVVKPEIKEQLLGVT
ncbi:AMP-binding protein [Aeromicrobium alkaliterrae]|uniref:Long-chain fatty acid--CoA ligase n=1 Tax=Aeromicrobium alkaliterrae TaxID=302168 RepID=A0ABP4VUB7_9ACTN